MPTLEEKLKKIPLTRNRLNLSYNQLSGSIPAELGNLTRLTRLYLHDNQLSGFIPVELSNLTSLTQLHLYNNQLSGSIPGELGNLTRLMVLHLQNNQLRGAEPGALSELVAIQYLNLQNNGMSQAEVDAIISEIYGARSCYNNGIDKVLKIGGTNTAPGEVALVQIEDLKASFHWNIKFTEPKAISVIKESIKENIFQKRRTRMQIVLDTIKRKT